jgi:hypothetical protein
MPEETESAIKPEETDGENMPEETERERTLRERKERTRAYRERMDQREKKALEKREIKRKAQKIREERNLAKREESRKRRRPEAKPVPFSEVQEYIAAVDATVHPVEPWIEGLGIPKTEKIRRGINRDRENQIKAKIARMAGVAVEPIENKSAATVEAAFDTGVKETIRAGGITVTGEIDPERWSVFRKRCGTKIGLGKYMADIRRDARKNGTVQDCPETTYGYTEEAQGDTGTTAYGYSDVLYGSRELTEAEKAEKYKGFYTPPVNFGIPGLNDEDDDAFEAETELEESFEAELQESFETVTEFKESTGAKVTAEAGFEENAVAETVAEAGFEESAGAKAEREAGFEENAGTEITAEAGFEGSFETELKESASAEFVTKSEKKAEEKAETDGKPEKSKSMSARSTRNAEFILNYPIEQQNPKERKVWTGFSKKRWFLAYTACTVAVGFIISLGIFLPMIFRNYIPSPAGPGMEYINPPGGTDETLPSFPEGTVKHMDITVEEIAQNKGLLFDIAQIWQHKEIYYETAIGDDSLILFYMIRDIFAVLPNGKSGFFADYCIFPNYVYMFDGFGGWTGFTESFTVGEKTINYKIVEEELLGKVKKVCYVRCNHDNAEHLLKITELAGELNEENLRLLFGAQE